MKTFVVRLKNGSGKAYYVSGEKLTPTAAADAVHANCMDRSVSALEFQEIRAVDVDLKGLSAPKFKTKEYEIREMA